MRSDIFFVDAMTKKFLFWLGLLAVSFLMMVQPAHAALEQVAPISGGWFYSPYGTGSPSSNKTTVLEACTSASNFTTGTTIYDHIVLLPGWETAAHGASVAECWGKRVSDGVIVWARWITKVFVTATCPVPTVQPEVPYVYNSATNWCERTITDCPHTVLGIETSRGYTFSTSNQFSYASCDSYGCEVSIDRVASIFGVSLMHLSATPNACVGTLPPALTVTFTEAEAPTAPAKIDYDAVVAAAAAVAATDPPAEIARVEAVTYELDRSGFSVIESVKAATDAVAAENIVATDTVTAAINYARDPTPANLEIYEGFKASFRAKSAAANDAITRAKSDYDVARGNAAAEPLLTSGAEKIKQAADNLGTAIEKSGLPYDTAQVDAALGDTAALDAQLAAASAALAGLNAQIAATTAALADLISQMTQLTASVQDAIDRLDGLGVPPDPLEPPLPPPPPPPAPPPVDCKLTPNAPGCYVPPPVDCTLTPSAPGCALPVDCSLTPNAPGCFSECTAHPELAACAELGTIADDVPLDTKEISIAAIQPVSVGGAGACPAPLPLVLHGQTYFMKFDTYCQFATGIKPIILVFAWLAGAGILIGGFKAA